MSGWAAVGLAWTDGSGVWSWRAPEILVTAAAIMLGKETVLLQGEGPGEKEIG